MKNIVLRKDFFLSSEEFIEFNENERFKTFLNFSLFLFLITLVLFLFSGCARKEVVVKYKYIEKPCPTLQTIDLNELNLNPDKPLKFNFTVKEKENK